jgi:YHS domain-containing protein
MFSRPKFMLVLAAAVYCLPLVAGAEPIGVAWRTNLDASKLEAAQTGRLLLLHFYTQSCMPCKVLDQNVLNQPQVGAAVERSYVPVKVDADAQPGLRNWLRVEQVPTDVVMTPDGNVVATLSTPQTPDAYIEQLENLARHFRATTPGAGGAQQSAVNSTYASLPVRATAGGATAAVVQRYDQTVPPVTNSYAGAAGPSMLRAQGNPYVAGGAPAAGAVAGSAMIAGQPGVPPTARVAPPTGAVAAAGAPVMPTNAMPTSYRNPMFAGPPSTAGVAAPGVAAAPGAASIPGVVAPPTTAAAGLAATAPMNVARPDAAAAGAPMVDAAMIARPSNPPITPPPSTVAPPATAVVQTAPQQLPPNSPPVAFDGCCPVTLSTISKWVPGSAAFGAIHRGRTYLFAGEPQRQQFLANPDAYSPVFAGYDPVLLLEKQQTVQGTRKYGFKYGGAFYLFSSSETMSKFRDSPQTYAAGVRQAMARVDGSAGGVIRR